MEVLKVYVGDTISDLDSDTCGPYLATLAQLRSELRFHLGDDRAEAGCERVCSLSSILLSQWRRV